MGLQIEATYDDKRSRQYVNGEVTVFHCHHYAALFTQLADDAGMFDGARHLRDAAAESMLPVLKKQCEIDGATSAEDKTAVAEQYFSYIGLGKLSINIPDAKAEMAFSHVDDGWIRKWGNRDKPVNFIGQGYIAAAFALVNGDDPSTYVVEETQSIVSGATSSKFTVSKK